MGGMRIKSQLCERARQWASLRVDGELSELEGALLDAHVGRCASCRAFVTEADRIAAALRAVAPEPPPAPVVVDLPKRRAAPPRLLQTAVAAALIVLAAGLGSLLGVAGRSGSATPSAVPRHTAMVATEDSPNALRALRRPNLIDSSHIPRNRAIPGENV
jgi:predicted anti-sigma-YlaC factor YlaD